MNRTTFHFTEQSVTTKYRAITLDLDNTLWDMWSVIRHAEKNSYRYLQEHYPRVAERYSVDDIPDLRWSLIDRRPELQHDVTEIRRQLFIEMLNECAYDAADAEMLLSQFLVDRNNVELYPDALPALQALSQQYPLVALTDGNSDLASIGIREYFVGSVYAIDVGFTKPHPAGFLKACEIAGTNPDETIHVGDCPTADIAGAHGAGLHSMWVRRNGEEWTEEYTPNYTVTTLTEAVEILC